MTSAEVSGSAGVLPPLQSVQRALALPSVGLAVGQVGALYSRVKDANSLFNWALSTAEQTVLLAAQGASPYVASPLAAADARLAAALGELERRVPLVAQQPKVILHTAKEAITARVSPHVHKVCAARATAQKSVGSLKELSWAKANELLSTPYGQKALSSVDSSAALAHRLLDYYLPPQEGESQEGGVADAGSDPALHTVQTVGRLSAVAGARLWSTLARRLRTLGSEDLDPRRYLAALLAVAHLARLTQPAAPRTPAPAPPSPALPAQPPVAAH